MSAKTIWHTRRELERLGVDLHHVPAELWPVLAGMIATHGVAAVKEKADQYRKERKHGQRPALSRWEK